jgi:pyridoxine kinase
MFNGFTVKDLTDQLIPITEHWKKENIRFDAIYTGYLGSEEEIGIAEKIFRDFGSGDTLIFIDPVMADNGKLYPAFDEHYAGLNAKLCGKADIIVPNITEACFMTGTDYKESYDEDYILKLLDRLSELGAKKSFLTGVSLSEGKTGVYGYDRESGEYTVYQNDRVDAAYHGTGDIFSSTAVGCLTRGLPLYESFKIAADYTAETIRVTVNDPEKPWYGVDFETTLPGLIKTVETSENSEK